ncbi:MAG: hypothetical protein WCH74_11900, partial [Chloroflexota bacterium]
MTRNTRAPARTALFRKVGWLAVAGMVALSLAGPGAGTATATAVPAYATVSGYAEGSAANNHEATWGSDCTKLENPGGSTYVLTQNYAKVIVKAGSDVSTDGHANTVFNDPLAGQTVWADSNGSGAFDTAPEPADKTISHIIFCGPSVAPSVEPSVAPSVAPS